MQVRLKMTPLAFSENKLTGEWELFIKTGNTYNYPYLSFHLRSPYVDPYI